MKGDMQDNAGVIWYTPLIYLIPLIAGLILHCAVSVTFLSDRLERVL